MPNVVSIGNFKHDFCSEVHFARELEGLGYTVTRLQEPSDPRDHKIFIDKLLSVCKADVPDLVMYTRTWGVPGLTPIWRQLEDMGAVTCSFHLDLYVGLKRGGRIFEDPFWTTEYVFTPDGDPKSAEFFAEHGINHHWSPPAVVSDECVPGEFRPEYAFDVVFVGSYGYHDEWPWRPQLIDYLKDRYGPRFRRFGGDLPEGPVRGQRLNDLYASAKVVVGDSLHLPGHTRYFTDRYFETVGRGGFLIAPYVEGIEEFLGSEHLAYYAHPDGAFSTEAALKTLGDSIDFWLRDSDRRHLIQEQGQEHVRHHHTYRHRLAKALTTMGFGAHVHHALMGRIVEEPIEWVQGYVKLTKEWHAGDPDYGPPPPFTTENFGGAIEGLGVVNWKRIDKLELGSGYYPTEGFTHLDLNPNCPDVDIVGTAWPLDLGDGSVGEIRAVDVLEHLPYWDSQAILADWFRVLEPGGKLYVQVPAADLIMQWFVHEPERLIDRLPEGLPQTALAGAGWRLLGGLSDGEHTIGDDDWRFNVHAAMFSEASIRELLETAGFEDIEILINIHPNLQVTARRPS